MSMKPSETSPRPGTATRTTLTRRRLLNTLAVSGVAVVGGGALGSLGYAVEHLGVRLVMVLGHERCGAVQATHDVLTKGEKVPGHIAALVIPIVPAVQAAQTMSGDVVDNAVTANVRMVTARVRTTAPILSAHVQKGALNVVGARYDLKSGAVTLIA